jgi:glucokinase
MGALAYPDFVLGPGTGLGSGTMMSGTKVEKTAPGLTPVRVE